MPSKPLSHRSTAYAVQVVCCVQVATSISSQKSAQPYTYRYQAAHHASDVQHGIGELDGEYAHQTKNVASTWHEQETCMRAHVPLTFILSAPMQIRSTFLDQNKLITLCAANL